MNLSTFKALKYKNFRLLWISLAISQFGTQMQDVGVAWHIYEITHSPAALGIIGLMGFLPILFFSLFSGVIADRVDRLKLIIVAQVLIGILSLCLGLLTINGQVNPFFIYLILFLNGTALAFCLPARQAVLPSLVPKEIFMNAVSLNTLTKESAVILGPALAGFAIELFKVQSIYIFNVFISLFALIGLLQVKIPKIESLGKIEFSLASIIEGIKFVRNTPILYSTMILDFLATFFALATVLMPIFAKDILHVGARGLGFLYAAPSVGGLITGLIVSSMGTIKNQGKIILIAVFFFGLATIGFGLSGNFYLSLFFLSIMGASDVVSMVIRNTIRQMVTPDYLRGRMVSINMIFFAGGPQLGELEAGLLAAVVGASASVAIGGIGTVLTVFAITILTPKLLNYKSEK